MKASPKITKVTVTTFEHELENVGKDYNTFNMVYEAGSKLKQTGTVLQIHTDQGIVGEYPEIGRALGDVQTVADYLIGKDALNREKIYNDTKRGLRHGAMLGVGVIDICLWDIAGKLYDEPLYRLLGGEKKPLPAYHQRCTVMKTADSKLKKTSQSLQNSVTRWDTARSKCTDGGSPVATSNEKSTTFSTSVSSSKTEWIC